MRLFIILLFVACYFVACSGTRCVALEGKDLCYRSDKTYIPNKLQMKHLRAQMVFTISDSSSCNSFFYPHEDKPDTLFDLIVWSPNNCQGGDTSYVNYIYESEAEMLDANFIRFHPRNSVESAFLEHIGIDRKTLLDAARKLRD